MNPFKKYPRRIGRDPSGDGVGLGLKGATNIVEWHRNVIADYERWKKLNPVPNRCRHNQNPSSCDSCWATGV